MSYFNKSLLIWIFSVIFTLSIAIYQRMTGPSYPVSGKINIENQEYKYSLIRTFDGKGDADIKIEVPDKAVEGKYMYKRLSSSDEWTEKHLLRVKDELIAYIPHQPPAGKVIYQIFLEKDGQRFLLTKEPIVIRFKGAVPTYVILPHIILMFLAMLFSTRTGLEVVIKGKRTFVYTAITLFLLLPGGMILGPVVQKFAFGEYWTGWPFGQDLTDNKTVVAFIFWIIAFFRLLKNREKRGWALVAAIVLLLIYLIPHSMFGSEFNYESGQVTTGG